MTNGRAKMSEIYSETFWRLFEDLDRSLDPAGLDALHEIARPYVAPGAAILDVGCRDAGHLLRLLQVAGPHGSGIGIDPVRWHVERGHAAVQAAGVLDRVMVLEAVAEDLPLADDSMDFVWCRDVIEVLPDLDRAAAEMTRVLRPGGHLLAYTNVLAGAPDERETREIHEPLGNVVGNLVESQLVATLERHGLSIVQRIDVETEWREHQEEKQGTVSRDLLRLSRLRRQRDEIVASYGHQAFATAQASLQWTAWQFLGRFRPLVLVLQRSP